MDKVYYLNKFIRWYDPYRTLRVKRHVMIHRIGNSMLSDGYTPDEIYKLSDEAREHWNLAPIKREA